MSAAPLPAVVVGGTSEAPSSVAFILSAKAGPAKAAVAPSASVASTVLVFDMVLSLLAQSEGASFKTTRFRFYSRNRPKRPEFFKQSMAGIAALLAIKFRRTVTDRRMLRRIPLASVVAAAVGFAIFWWLTIPAAVP